MAPPRQPHGGSAAGGDHLALTMSPGGSVGGTPPPRSPSRSLRGTAAGLRTSKGPRPSEASSAGDPEGHGLLSSHGMEDGGSHHR